MLASITWEQFVEWMVYAEVEPFGEERADIRSAQITTMLANIHRDPKKTSSYKIEDFLLRFGDYEAPKKTWQHLKQLGQLVFSAFGGGK